MMLWPFSDLDGKYREFAEREKKLEQSDHTRLVYQRLYSDLSILDTKGAALLQFISVFATAYTIILAFPHALSGGYSKIFLNFGATCAYLSATFALFVLWVRWAGKDDDPEKRAEAIFKVRYHRTVIYRISWLLGVAALLCLGVCLASSRMW